MDIEISKIRQLKNVRTSENTDPELVQLMQTMKQHGQLEQAGVWKENEEYILAYGNRRFLAAKKLGWKYLDCKVLPAPLNSTDFLIINAIENIHRKDVLPVELGKICSELATAGLTHGEIGARLSVPKAKIEQCIKLYNSVPEKFKGSIGFLTGLEHKYGRISAAVASKIIKMSMSADKREKLFEAAKNDELTVDVIDLIYELMSSGYTLSQALSKRKEYRVRIFRVVVNIKTEEEVISSHPEIALSKGKIYMGILNGKIPAKEGLVRNIH